MTTVAERLAFSPFTHQMLDADLRAAGMTPLSSTYAANTDPYLVTARRGRRTNPGAGRTTAESPDHSQ